MRKEGNPNTLQRLLIAGTILASTRTAHVSETFAQTNPDPTTTERVMPKGNVSEPKSDPNAIVLSTMTAILLTSYLAIKFKPWRRRR